MDLTVILLLLASGALILPLLGGDDDDSSEEINGTLDDDVINGTDGNDVINGFDGVDLIMAGGGEDFVNAGLGNDTVFGGDDRDVIEGRAGNDTLYGEDGSDTIEGGMGNDRIDGGRDFDIIRGGNDDDVILGGAPAVVGDDGELVFDNNRGDTLRGNDGNDTVFLWGNQGLAVGGDGEDTLVLVTGQGTLEDESGETNFFILANAEDDTIPTRGTITEFNPMQDTLTLTVDAVIPDGEAPPDVTFSLQERSVLEGTTVVNGVFVLAELADGEAPIEGSEGAGVFLRGATLDLLVGADIDVVFTNGADYFDPESTLDEVLAARMPAIT